jgi:DNA-binding LytR/AlgR family response regulator
MHGLHALVVDDEQPVLDELVFLLGRDERIASVRAARSGTEALRVLEAGDVDLVFLDVVMPGLSGLEIGRVLTRFRTPPRIVFVTAHEAHAVEAFDLGVVDFLLKPIREDRLRESVRRAGAEADSDPTSADESIAIELGGVTRFIQRSLVAYAEAQGDYVRLHTTCETAPASGGYLLRIPLAELAKRWQHAGFIRIHRSTLVASGHIRELRFDAGRAAVQVGDEILPVSRRHTREVRDLLVRRFKTPGDRE